MLPLYNGWCVDWKGKKQKGNAQRWRWCHFPGETDLITSTKEQAILRSSHHKISANPKVSKDLETTRENIQMRVHSPRLQKTSTDHKGTCQRLLRNGSTKGQPTSLGCTNSLNSFKVLLQEKRLNEVWVQCNKPSLFIKLCVINVCMVTV